MYPKTKTKENKQDTGKPDSWRHGHKLSLLPQGAENMAPLISP